MTPDDPQANGTPDAVRTLFDEALGHHRAERLDEAGRIYRRILVLVPRHADSLHMLGSIAHRMGRVDAAIDLIGQAIGIRDDVAVYHLSLGNALLDRGRLDEAAVEYQRTLVLKPDLALAHNNLGLVHHARHRPAEAAACFERAVALKPDFAGAHTNLGTMLREQGRPDLARVRYRQAMALKADDAQTHNNLGSVLMDLGRLTEAAAQYRRALALSPDFAEAHNNLGTVFHRQGRSSQAEARYRQALALNPALAEAHANLATVRRDQGLLSQAAAGYQRALELAPDFAQAHDGLAIVRKEQGRLDEALASSRRALELNPHSARFHSSLLMGLSYSPEIDEAGIAAACRDWGRRHGQPPQGQPPQGQPPQGQPPQGQPPQGEPPQGTVPGHPNTPEPGRGLRVGYVSNNLRRHPVGWFLASVWPAHDPAEVAIHAYSGVVVEDAMTRQLRRSAAVWRDTATLSDAELAERIRADGIDLLVDLDGHTEANRLPVFSRRPAPVQLSWLGHGHTTGLAAIDAVLMDDATVPPGNEGWFTEAMVRLPGGRLCYAPPDYAPQVSPPPCRSRGRVTFGSFNNLAKVSPAVLGLWARVLAAVPGARLWLQWKSLADLAERSRLCAAFAAAGGDANRLVLQGASPHPAMLAAYGGIDIALDPFPFGGGLTSCEALWMGVPVVTWPGARPMSRQTLGFLTALGLGEELVADSAGAYVALAAGLAAAPERLATLRTGLRPRMAASPLCDGPRLARDLETVYRRLWQRWCSGGAGEPKR